MFLFEAPSTLALVFHGLECLYQASTSSGGAPAPNNIVDAEIGTRLIVILPYFVATISRAWQIANDEHSGVGNT